MKRRSREGFLTQIGVLGREMERLGVVEKQNTAAVGRLEVATPSWMEYVVVAYTLHNAYSLMESYFLRVAKFFENEIGDSSWHKDLLQRMTVAINGIRPALLTSDDAELIDELRGFRHLYRNLYEKQIQHEKVGALQSRFPGILSRFRNAHNHFIQKLRKIANSLGE